MRVSKGAPSALAASLCESTVHSDFEPLSSPLSATEDGESRSPWPEEMGERGWLPNSFCPRV